MARCVVALAGLTVRNAVRSRVVWAPAFGIFLGVVGVPFFLRSDGTPTGHAQLLLYYSLGLAGFLLSIAAVWAGSGAISLEIENRHAPLLTSKPVHAWQLWLGKWVGLLALNALLLGLAGVLNGLALAWSVRGSAGWTEADHFRLAEEILVARREIAPEPEDMAEATAKRVADLRRKDAIPAGPLSAGDSAQIAKDLLLEAATIAPGGRKSWVFILPTGTTSSRPLTLRFRFDGSSDGPLADVAARWEIAGQDGIVLFQRQGEYAPGAIHAITIPAEVVSAAAGKMVVSYGNVEAKGAPTVIFPVKGGITVHAYAGGFLPNYLRALFVMFCRLAILSAFGLGMGCCFSFPTASFVTFSFLLFSSIENWNELPVGTDTERIIGVVWRLPIVEYLLAGLDMIIAPLYKLSPLANLSEGLLVSWGFVLRALGDAVLYPAVLMLVGAALFRRRELGLFT